MWSAAHVVALLVVVQLGKHCLGVLTLDLGDIVHVTKEKVVYLMRHVQGLYHVVDPQPSVYVLVSVTRDVEVTRHLLHCEIAFESATVAFLEGLLGQLVLSFLVRLVQQLKIVASVDLLPITVQSELLD